MTEQEKWEAYAKGQYRFKAPPVCTAGWSDGAWIRYIDSYNGWITKQGENHGKNHQKTD